MIEWCIYIALCVLLEKSCQVKFSEIIFVSFSFFVFSVSREISQWCDKKKSEVARPAFQEKKKVSATLKVSLWFNNRHTLGPYRGPNNQR